MSCTEIQQKSIFIDERKILSSTGGSGGKVSILFFYFSASLRRRRRLRLLKSVCISSSITLLAEFPFQTKSECRSIFIFSKSKWGGFNMFVVGLQKHADCSSLKINYFWTTHPFLRYRQTTLAATVSAKEPFIFLPRARSSPICHLLYKGHQRDGRTTGNVDDVWRCNFRCSIMSI